MNNTHSIFKPLTEITTVERAQKSKVYPIGTLYIQVSACKRAGEEAWEILGMPQGLDSKYAVAIPKIEVVPKYLQLALEAVTPEWHKKYVGTNINISMDAFKYLEVGIDMNIANQMQVVNYFRTVERQAQLLKEQVKREQQVKRWCLCKMFPE